MNLTRTFSINLILHGWRTGRGEINSGNSKKNSSFSIFKCLTWYFYSRMGSKMRDWELLNIQQCRFENYYRTKFITVKFVLVTLQSSNVLRRQNNRLKSVPPTPELLEISRSFKLLESMWALVFINQCLSC